MVKQGNSGDEHMGMLMILQDLQKKTKYSLQEKETKKIKNIKIQKKILK